MFNTKAVEAVEKVRLPDVAVVRGSVVVGSQILFDSSYETQKNTASVLMQQIAHFAVHCVQSGTKRLLMPVEGLEPSTPYEELFLRQSRMPIPPHWPIHGCLRTVAIVTFVREEYDSVSGPRSQ